MPKQTIQIGMIACAGAILLSGCGTQQNSPTATSNVVGKTGPQTVTFHVRGMGERLHLM